MVCIEIFVGAVILVLAWVYSRSRMHHGHQNGVHDQCRYCLYVLQLVLLLVVHVSQVLYRMIGLESWTQTTVDDFLLSHVLVRA